MSHLVRPLHREIAEADPARCTALLRHAQVYLAERGQAALSGLSAGDPRSWGRHMKRATVRLDGERPLLVEATGAHNLGEVINQCATLERLIDALEWVQSQPDLRELRVSRCHPTTSSDGDPGDNDLVLVDAEGNARACFEVSDVSGKADGNDKEKSDLISLGLLPNKHGALRARPGGCRRFLVVSSSFATYLSRRRREPLPFVYHRAFTAAASTAPEYATVILEIVPATAAVPADAPSQNPV